MQQRFVGSTGLSVSRLGLGTMTWGRDTDEHEAREQLVAFVDAGGTLLDTAAGYTDGDSERLIGSLIGAVCDRDEIVLATKAGLSRRGRDRVTNASRGHLISTLDASLKRLGVDHVDLWQVHVWVDDAPLEETLSAFDYAVSTGRASYVGVSNYSGWQSAQAATWQRAVPGRAPLASHQVEYSLLNRSAEAEVVPAAQALGLGILPWSPLGRGVLTGKYRGGTPADSLRRLAALLHVCGPLPRGVLPAGGRRGGTCGRRPGLVAARGLPGLGARPSRRHRPHRRRANLSPAAGVARRRGVRAAPRDRAGSAGRLGGAGGHWMSSGRQLRTERRALRPGVEYEFDKLLISREVSRGAVTRSWSRWPNRVAGSSTGSDSVPTAPDGYSFAAGSSGSGSSP